MYKIIFNIKRFFLWFSRKFLLEKHRFAPSTLVFKDGTRTLYEVYNNYYSKDLLPLTIVRPYPAGSQFLVVDYHENKEFVEYKGAVGTGIGSTASDVATTAHDNLKFGKRVK